MDAREKRSNWTQNSTVLTSRWSSVPVLIALLAGIFWLTIAGANVPSSFLAHLLMEEGGLAAFFGADPAVAATHGIFGYSVYEYLHMLFALPAAPAWLAGFLIDGVYLGLAWVVSVMLPPMAIFFPLFTFFEDLGLLPRVALNLDRPFRCVGSNGKQALTMCMGFGCNAAGVIGARIINSPREKLIAILTNNFVPCNGRWPTLIMASSIFVAATVQPWIATVVSVGAVTAVTLLGVRVTFAVSCALSRTVLRGVPSAFATEIPPYRPPALGRIVYTLGLDGVILLAFIFAIPANEIVIPTVIMGYMETSRMVELGDPSALFVANEWTWLTALAVMLFSLLHYPCTTTTLTIRAETGSLKWTALANLIPLSIAVVVCFLVAQTARLLFF